MIRTIIPYNLDELQYHLGRKSGSLTVYYPLYDGDPRTADYVAEVTWDDAEIVYTLGGHGIGSNRVHVPNTEALIVRIIEDNDRFNRSNAFQIEFSDSRVS